MTAERHALDVLRAALDEQAAATDGVERVADGDAVEYRLKGHAAVSVDRRVIAFRLGQRVAAAAARTVDARPSARGPEWVELAPAQIDRFTLDRAEAWFGLAIREAGGAAARTDRRLDA